MKKLILTIGLPRSGKSTWAMRSGFPVVNPDSIRLALHGQAFIAEAENFVWASAYLMAKALLIAGHDTVVIDATNTTAVRRQDWVRRFDKLARIDYIYFPTTEEECIARAKEDGREDLIQVIQRMSKNLDLEGVNISVKETAPYYCSGDGLAISELLSGQTKREFVIDADGKKYELVFNGTVDHCTVTICKKCKKVLRSCRCMTPKTQAVLGVCAECEGKQEGRA